MEVQITQDIRKYKPKDLGPFSLREVGFLIVAGAIGLASYKFLKTGIQTSVIIAAPVLAFGFLKPFGLTLFQFLKTIIKEEFFSPREYYNETDFEYDPNEFDELYGEKIQIPDGWNEKDVNAEFKRSKEDLKELIS
jgi:hypothetical protein